MASNSNQGASIRLSRVTLKPPTFFQHQKAEDRWLKTLFGAAIHRPDRRLNTILATSTSKPTTATASHSSGATAQARRACCTC